jgi:hypothetical protein
VTERELSPEGDFQLVDENVDENREDASRALVDLAQHLAQQDRNGEGHELERRSSQWVFPIFGRRREAGDIH